MDQDKQFLFEIIYLVQIAQQRKVWAAQLATDIAPWSRGVKLATVLV